MAHATGRGAPEQLRNGAREAARHGRERIDWNTPVETLRHHSQLDALDRTRGDTERCGAATLVAGVVLSGPEAPARLAAARTRLEGRLDDLNGRLDREWSNPRSTAFAATPDLRLARTALHDLPADTSRWTRDDLSRFEEAIYRTGRAELTMDGDRSTGGLTGSEMVRLRDVVWGEGWHPRTADGHEVDVVFAGNRAPGSVSLNHFVLGTEGAVSGSNRATVYDPWPQDDGTAFVRGGGAPERLLSLAPASAGATSPRPGVDLDWWR